MTTYLPIDHALEAIGGVLDPNHARKPARQPLGFYVVRDGVQIAWYRVKKDAQKFAAKLPGSRVQPEYSESLQS